jgi:hypothetical protein
MVRMQRVVCPACGHGHTFSLPVGEPIAPAYGYTCPETGRGATIGSQGQWQASEHPSQGAVALSTLVVAAEAPTTGVGP